MAHPLNRLYHHPTVRILALFGLGSLTILLPLLPRGHILTLDMAFGPTIPAPDSVTSSYVFRALLHITNKILPSDHIEKLLLFSILVLSAWGAYALVQSLKIKSPSLATYLSALLYTVNPYTYSRFMTGQYSVLLGYALVPFFCKALLRLLATPTYKDSLKLAAWVTVIGIVSIHTLGLVVVLSIVGGGLALWQHRQDMTHVKKLLRAGSLALASVFIASSYWLIPLALGQGRTAQTIRSFSGSDTAAFATAGDSVVGKLANIIRLQGFWAEARGLYLLPQDQLPAWGLVALGVWLMVFAGARWLWRSEYRFLILFFGVSAALATILALGLITIPGYREPHKFVGLVALFFAICAGQGSMRIVQKYQKKSELGGAFATVCCVVSLVAFTPTMFWGFGGQLSPRHYPNDWANINRQLSEDTGKFQTLFLPWHLYMHFAFAGRIIANPAPDFFDKPVLISDDPEFSGTARTTQDPLKDRLDNDILPQAPSRQDLGAQLATLRIKYILLAKESDASDYAYLDHQKDVKLITETPTLKLYRNEAWKD